MGENQYFIRHLISDLERGKIRIPSFQRGFVWEPERVAYFIDSIYKGFPFGSILIWRTRTPLKHERNLGPYKLPDSSPEYPIDYILDGQQRITSLFGIFQTSLTPEENQTIDWINLFFEINSQESIPFRYLEDPNNYDINKFFPLKYVFDTRKYRQSTRNLEPTLADKIDDLVTIFTEAIIPVEKFESEERQYVATVFERINRQGIELDTLQLLSVWNWSEDFDLQEKFKTITEELEPFGFQELGSNLLLKCCSGVIMNNSNPEAFVDLEGNEVRQRFDEIKTGIFGAIDFLKDQLSIFSLKLLPMENILVVLSSFFASAQKQPLPLSQDQYQVIKDWFWRSCFSKRYARGGAKSTNIDLLEINKLKTNQSHQLGNFNVQLDTDYFLKNTFNMGSVATKTFILLLAQNNPLNFIQGTKISLESVLSQGNRKEFHHIFPKAYLTNIKNPFESKEINCLANFSILSRADNNRINDQPPSQYLAQMPQVQRDEILKSHFCNCAMFTNDDYDNFLKLRADLLLKEAKKLSQINQIMIERVNQTEK